jgi:hypothetical protein
VLVVSEVELLAADWAEVVELELEGVDVAAVEADEVELWEDPPHAASASAVSGAAIASRRFIARQHRDAQPR